MKEFQEKMRQMAEAEGREYNEDDERRLLSGYQSDQQNMRESKQDVRNSMALLPYSGMKRQTAEQIRNAKAMQEIDKIKRTKKEREEGRRIE